MDEAEFLGEKLRLYSFARTRATNDEDHFSWLLLGGEGELIHCDGDSY